MGNKVRGTLVIIGGAEDREGECVILRRFVHLAGGAEAKIVIMTTATTAGADAGAEYTRVFRRLGAERTEVVNVDSRRDANRPAYARVVAAATGVFFTGGDQLRITSILGGTGLYRALQEAFTAGAVLAGTSAGASAMSGTMIVEGDSEASPKRDSLLMAPGMGLVEEIVIDQHFAQRGRLGRLLSAVAHNPYILGIGIDENTAVVVRPDAKFEVIGSSMVTVVDAASSTYTNVSELSHQEVLALTDTTLHILPAGFGFDLARRVPILPETKGD